MTVFTKFKSKITTFGEHFNEYDCFYKVQIRKLLLLEKYFYKMTDFTKLKSKNCSFLKTFKQKWLFFTKCEAENCYFWKIFHQKWPFLQCANPIRSSSSCWSCANFEVSRVNTRKLSYFYCCCGDKCFCFDFIQ